MVNPNKTSNRLILTLFKIKQKTFSFSTNFFDVSIDLKKLPLKGFNKPLFFVRVLNLNSKTSL